MNTVGFYSYVEYKKINENTKTKYMNKPNQTCRYGESKWRVEWVDGIKYMVMYGK